MSQDRNSKTGSHTGDQGETLTQSESGWVTDTELVRTYERPVDTAAAVTSVIQKAIQQWPELSETPPLYQFVEVEYLDGLLKKKAMNDSGRTPSVEFHFQSCRVTVLYGSLLRVIINRDP